MTNRTRRHAITFSAVLAGLGGSVHGAQADDRVAVTVRVENAADIPGPIVAGAKTEARRIYRSAGIDIVWLNHDDRGCCNGGRSVIRVILPTPDNADQFLRLEHVDRNALGVANAGTGMIHIIWERLHVLAAHQGRDEAGLLGVVLAHEIGHVLLPGAGHSPAGIMQASIELLTLAPLRFTAEQGAFMRSRLQREPDAEREPVTLAAAVAN